MLEKSEIKNAVSRIPYLDLLRIAAMFAMIMIHVSGSGWSSTEPATFNWNVYNIYNGCSRWCVPVFVMISGALFLNREVNIKKLYSKNIVRIATAFLFWSIIYGILSVLLYNNKIKLAIGEIIVGHYHLWFLFMIVGLYLAVPILKKITESEKLMSYFLKLSLVFSFVIPMTIQIVSLSSESIAKSMEKITGNISFNIAVGYTGYFVLGYFLSKAELNKKQQRNIYIAGLMGFAATVVLACVFSLMKRKRINLFDDYFSVSVLLESIGVFTFFKYRNFRLSEKALKLISTLSKYSFGVYLSHLMFWEFMKDKLEINVMICNPIVSVPLLTVIVAILSLGLSALINKIPVLNKYIV